LFPAIRKEKLKPDQKTFERLKKKLLSASLKPYPEKNDSAGIADQISGSTYSVAVNKNQIGSLSFLFKDNDCFLTLKSDSLVFRLSFGAGKWNLGESPAYFLPYTKLKLTDPPPFKVAGTYEWKDKNTLELLLRYIESPHKVKITCRFDKKAMQAKIENSRDRGIKEWILNAMLK
jgi:hypothetical protein